MTQTSPEEPKNTATELGFFSVAATVIFLVRIFPWLLSDLWYDEIITLTDFAIGPRNSTIFHVFGSYPVANNHVLFSAIAWCWVRLLQFNVAEYMLRIPSVVFGLLTLMCILWYWAKWLGPRVAGMAAVIFAMSPVYGPFAWQFRGYSLALLLATLAVPAVMELACGSRKRGILLYAPVAFLMPLVIPTNVLLPLGHLLFLFLLNPRSAQETDDRWARIAPVLGALILGSSYYLLIWPQFVRAARQTCGWSDPCAVGANFAVALLAHLGPLLVFFAVRSVAVWRQGAKAGASSREMYRSWGLLLACGLVVLPFLVTMRSTPFPRVFLTFLPTVSFCVLLGLRDLGFWKQKRILLLVGAVVLHGYVWDRGATFLTEREMAQGKYPQDLLRQYYRGNSELSTICRKIAVHPAKDRLVIITSAHDFPTFRYYWGLIGMHHARVLPPTAEARVIWEQYFRDSGFQLAAVALNEVDAARMLGMVGVTDPYSVAMRTPGRAVYHVLPQH